MTEEEEIIGTLTYDGVTYNKIAVSDLTHEACKSCAVHITGCQGTVYEPMIDCNPLSTGQSFILKAIK